MAKSARHHAKAAEISIVGNNGDPRLIRRLALRIKWLTIA
jgi:hypothetical protein